MRKNVLLILILFITVSGLFAQNDQPTLFRQPTMNKTDIVFSYAGDLWKVSRKGGAAERLTSGIGVEANPIFSPDGNLLAFTGEYDGNFDVFVIPATGGEPKRLTYHPGNDLVMGWTPDGKSILFVSSRGSATRLRKCLQFPLMMKDYLPSFLFRWLETVLLTHPMEQRSHICLCFRHLLNGKNIVAGELPEFGSEI